MTQSRFLRASRLAILVIVCLPIFGGTAAAQSSEVKGLIRARSGDLMVLQNGSSEVNVLLTDQTQVGQVQGVFQARRKGMSMAALIPGLAVKVKGAYDTQNRLVAQSVSFKGDDLERAEAIAAGMHETKMQAQQNKEQLEEHQAALQEHQQQIAANQAAIDAAVARFGQLDDYYIFDELTVYFSNGKTKLDGKYVPQLTALAEKAKSVNGYLVEVTGHASSVGSAALNQQLSEDRADAVTQVLTQQGHIPLSRMLAPGAMGETHQVGGNETETEQAQNRRVVVRVLQNKGIAGIQ